MITFEELTLRNFLSFGNKATTVNLNKEKTALITGMNLDKGDNGESKNGCGKSSILMGIIWCLFGESTEKMNQDGFINFVNKKNCEVSVTFTKNETQYQVIRGRKPNKLQLLINNEDMSRDSVANTQSYVEEILGMDFDIFTHTEFLYVHDSPFMALTDAKQRNFMENFLSLETLTKRANTLKTLQSDNKKEIELEQKRLETAREHNQRIQQQIQSLQQKKEDWDRDQQQKIETIDQRIKELQDQLENRSEDKKVLEEYDQLKKDRKEKEQEYNDQNNEYQQLQSTIQQLETEQKRLDKLTDVEEIKKNAANEEKEIVGELESTPDINFDEVIAITEEYVSVCDQITQYERELDRLQKDYEREDQEKDQIDKEIEDVKAGICPRCKQEWHDGEEIQTLQNKRDQINKEQSTIEEDFFEKEREYNELQNRKTEIESHSQLIEGYPIRPKKYRELQQRVTELQNKKDKIAEQTEERINSVKQQEDEIITEIIRIVEPFSGEDEEQKIDAIYNMNDSLHETLTSYNNEINSIQSKIDEIDQKIRKGTILTEDKAASLEQQITEKKDEKEKLQNETNPFDEQIQELSSEDQYKDESEDHYYKLKKYEEHYKILIKLLTDNKSFIRKNIINQYVPYINKKLNEYLAKLDSQHIVEINSDLSVDLYYVDYPVGYGNLSRGEKLRLNLGTSLAFRDLNRLLGKSSNLLMVDEYLDSAVDPAGFRQVFELLKAFSFHTMIISHRDDLIPMVDEIITVKKKNAFTTIEYG